MTLDCTVAASISFATAQAPRKFLQDLQRELTYANPKYHRQQAMGYYVGTIPRQIRTYTTEGDQTLVQRGAVGKMRKLALHHGVDLRWTDKRLRVPAKFKSKIVLRDYQQPAVDAALESMQGVIRGPCGCGKTLVLLAAIERFQQRTLVIVWNNVLMDQWIERIHDFFGIDAGVIGGGRCDLDSPIVCGMQQTLMRGVEQYLPLFGAVVVDETHRLGAGSWQGVVNPFPAAVRIGASADETRKDGLDFLVYDTLGDVFHEIRNEQLVDAGKAMPVTIRVIPTQYDDPVYRTARGAARDNTQMINCMVADADRNSLILRTILSQYDPTIRRPMLVLVERRAACTYWCDELRRHGMQVGLMLGGAANKRETEQTRQGLIGGELDCAVSTTVADEALDVPELAREFILTPTARHFRRMTQQVGRLKRPAQGKTDALCFYFLDSLLFPGHLKMIRKHFENVSVVDL